MRQLTLLFSMFIILFSCGSPQPPAEPKIDLTKYPEDLQKIFARHGGLETWNKMKAMSYEIVKDGGNEKQMIDLKDRRERIEASSFKTGYDGKDFWLEADTSYKGNPVFYHNLMFYFYAMPFVLADDGIIYSEAAPLSFEEKNYPGIKIAFDAGVGVSPEDEYFIHFDPDTYEMAWLGYTVTFSSGKKSQDIHWIRYNDWKNFNGLLLPNTLSWYKYENGLPTELRNVREFAEVTVSEEAFADDVFAKPEGAEVVE
ncbi:MAG: DUF6503 family protein [Bacteroidota bacterium]